MAAKPQKTFKPVVATANDLASGISVYRRADNVWSPDVTQAQVANTAEEAADLQKKVDRDFAANLIVEGLLIAVVNAPALRPQSLREIIRAEGPTIDVPPAPLVHSPA